MKSYNHLWEKLISEENILQAIQTAAQGNMKRRKLTLIKENPHKYAQSIRTAINLQRLDSKNKYF